MLERVVAKGHSVCPSVGLSVRHICDQHLAVVIRARKNLDFIEKVWRFFLGF